MTGAHGSLAAAFSGTVLWMWQPYSQLATPFVWTTLQIGFVWSLRRSATRAAAAKRLATV